jgi:plastocyanin
MRIRFAATLLMSTLSMAAQAAEVTVSMQEAEYTPAMVDAEVGDRILFVNDDVVDHEVFVPTAGHGIDLGKQTPGTKSIMPLGKPGRFEVECVIHPHMHLEVRVTEKEEK